LPWYHPSVSTPDPSAKTPPQIPFIIGNEACERFSFYGMRNILTKFLPASLLLAYLPAAEREGAASGIFHTFVMGVYFFPLLGGWLSDRFFGKYNTILWFSLIYCIGQGCLALFVDDRAGFFTGLFLIALGSGGIKPLVSSFVGDQFDHRTKHLAKRVYDAFYWSINLGSFFASLLMPIALREHGPMVAFGIPGILMFVATVVFWFGRGRYIRVTPAPPNPHSFLRVSATAIRSTSLAGAPPVRGFVIAGGIFGALTLALLPWCELVPTVITAGVLLALLWGAAAFLRVEHARGRGNRIGIVFAVYGVLAAAAAFALWPVLEPVPIVCLALVSIIALGGIGVAKSLEGARGRHPDDAIDGVRAVLRILIVFALITPFWSLFDQKASLWVFQGNHMVQPEWFESSQMQVVNPGLIMVLLPLLSLVVYPWLEKRRGRPLQPLGKMANGIALAGGAFVCVAVIQLLLDSKVELWIFWQIIPYVLLTCGEILVSATGLEFAYSQAPLAMKGVIMSFFNLAVTVGNLWVLLANSSVKHPSIVAAVTQTGLSERAFLMCFFAVFAFAAAAVFKVYARRYQMADNYQHTAPAPVAAGIPKATARPK
jgi:proton-dependent oligopeptide transporter, POT family